MTRAAPAVAAMGQTTDRIDPANKGRRPRGRAPVWRVDATGTSIDGEAASAITIADLGLVAGELIRMRIGVDPDATNVGGLNLFGSKFGDHPQDIEVRIEYAVSGVVAGIPKNGDVEVTSVVGDL
jgi:hypothetical protein